MKAYKYCSIEHAIDNLVKHRIKISEYQDMNDPFELRGAVPSMPEFYAVFLDVITSLGVLCFSMTDSEPLLWSHYAEKHRGCCIGFEIDESVNTEKTIPVDKPKELFVNETRLEKFVLEAVKSGRFPIVEGDPELEKLSSDSEFDDITKAIMFSKYQRWSYEEEIRVMLKLIPEQKDGNLYFAEFDRLKPVEVLLGARCTDADEERLRDAVNSYDPALPIVRTTLAVNEFRIIRRNKR